MLLAQSLLTYSALNVNVTRTIHRKTKRNNITHQTTNPL